ncbi:hypothetical protein L0244_27370, partial [bacterium]|nr:hypothetical protein [bacterium]
DEAPLPILSTMMPPGRQCFSNAPTFIYQADMMKVSFTLPNYALASNNFANLMSKFQQEP